MILWLYEYGLKDTSAMLRYRRRGTFSEQLRRFRIDSKTPLIERGVRCAKNTTHCWKSALHTVISESPTSWVVYIFPSRMISNHVYTFEVYGLYVWSPDCSIPK